MPFGAYGIRRLLDASQRFTAAGLPVYLRVKAFTSNPDIEEMGFVFTPTNPANTGTRDFQIDPPPEIKLISMHSLAMAQAAGIQLRAGARSVKISHSWVVARQAQQIFSTPQQVFNDPSVVGIVTDNLLMEIVNMTHSDLYGEIISWNLVCNCSEISGA